MGCSPSSDSQGSVVVAQKDPKPAAQPPKKVDRAMLVVTNKKDETIERKRGDIDGNQFQTDELENCKIIVKDSVDSMTIDRCYNCEFAMSAVHGSIFVRDCQNCKFTVNCGQFRCRNCSNCEFYMHSRTGPVVEASNNISIGCGTFSYPGVLEDLKRAQIYPNVSQFSDVHDFTPGQGNFTVKDGEKINMSIESETCELPFFHVLLPGEVNPTYKVASDKWNELCKLSFSIKIYEIKKLSNCFEVTIENNPSAISQIQTLA